MSPPSLSLRLRQNNRPYGYRGLKIITSLKLRFQDFQRKHKAIILFGVFILATSLWAFYELTKPKVATEWFDSRVYNKPKISLPKDDGYHANKMSV